VNSPPDEPDAATGASARPEAIPFETVYDTYFSFVWRSALRLGVLPHQVDDVVQEVFIVVYPLLFIGNLPHAVNFDDCVFWTSSEGGVGWSCSYEYNVVIQ
jgi:hypothetical protein